MGSGDRERAIDRFVAGMPVGDDELSAEVTARAVDATIVVNALLRGLEHESPDVRLRSTRRVARMIELAPRLRARLQQLAAADDDRDVRAGAEAALEAHPERDDAGSSPRVAWLPRLWLAWPATRSAGTTRGPSRARRVLLSFSARERAEAPDVRGRISEQAGEVQIDLNGLPERFVGGRLAVVAHAAGLEDATELAITEVPVPTSRSVSIAVTLSVEAVEAILEALDELELVGVEE